MHPAARNDAALPADEIDRRLHRSAGRDEIIEHCNALTRRDRVGLHFNRVAAVFEVIGKPHGLAGQLALFADHRKTASKRISDWRSDQKTT